MRFPLRYKLPVLVAENGLPDPTGGETDDQSRIDFLSDHLFTLHEAIESGVKVLSFHAWSLLDNFEWARGYTQPWGLVAVDRTTLERSPKRSATGYGKVATTRSLTA